MKLEGSLSLDHILRHMNPAHALTYLFKTHYIILPSIHYIFMAIHIQYGAFWTVNTVCYWNKFSQFQKSLLLLSSGQK
jgi:hypothetical protein